MINKHVKIVIEGVTEDGKRFRPSDWIERISGNLSTFGNDRRIRYSRYLQPQILQGQKCLVIDPELRGAHQKQKVAAPAHPCARPGAAERRRPTGTWEDRATPGAVAGRRESDHRRLLKNSVFQQPATTPSG